MCGALISLLMGFAWLVLMKYLAACIVWLTILLAFCTLVIVTVVGYFKAGILTSTQFTTVVRHACTRECVEKGSLCAMPCVGHTH